MGLLGKQRYRPGTDPVQTRNPSNAPVHPSIVTFNRFTHTFSWSVPGMIPITQEQLSTTHLTKGTSLHLKSRNYIYQNTKWLKMATWNDWLKCRQLHGWLTYWGCKSIVVYLPKFFTWVYPGKTCGYLGLPMYRPCKDQELTKFAQVILTQNYKKIP